MPLPEKWDTVDDIPETLRPLVGAEGDLKIIGDDEHGYRVFSEDLVPKTKLKATLDERETAKSELEKLQAKAKADAAKAKAKLEEMQAQLAAGPKNEEVEALLADRLAEIEIGGAKVQVAKVGVGTLTTQIEELRTAATTATEREAKAQERLERTLMTQEVTEARADIGTRHALQESAGANITMFVAQHGKLDPELGRIVFPDPGANGEPMQNPKTGRAYGVTDMVETVITDGLKAYGLPAMQGAWTRSPDAPKDRITRRSTPPPGAPKTSFEKHVQAIQRLEAGAK